MTDGIKLKHRRAIIEVLSANPKVERLVLFGSRAKGTFSPSPDIDLVLFGEHLNLSDISALSESLEELTVPQRVDLLVYHRIESPKLREQILKYGVEWYDRGKNLKTTEDC